MPALCERHLSAGLALFALAAGSPECHSGEVTGGEHRVLAELLLAPPVDGSLEVDNSTGWFPPLIDGVAGAAIDAAQPGTAFLSQSYDPGRLALLNTFDPKQDVLDDIRASAAEANSLGAAKVTVMSWEPRIIVVDNFMTDEEADYLVKSTGGLQNLGSTAVVTKDGGAQVLKNTVTSRIGTFPETDPTVLKITRRIEQLSFIPTDWAEPLHVLHYDPGQYFRGHLDVHAKKGRHTSSRIATCFLYLSDVEEGGETYFPLAKRADGGRDPVPDTCAGFEGKDTKSGLPTEQEKEQTEQYYDGSEFKAGRFSDEEMAKLGLVVKPKKGRAVLWWNRKKTGGVDWRSRHVGCPLVKGEKWAATRWIHYHDPSATARRVYDASTGGCVALRSPRYSQYIVAFALRQFSATLLFYWAPSWCHIGDFKIALQLRGAKVFGVHRLGRQYLLAWSVFMCTCSSVFVLW